MLVIIRQIVPWVKSLLDVIRQMCSLSQEFAGHHPANVFLESRVCRMSSGKCSFGWEFAGHHSTTIDDDYQTFGSNLYIYRGTSIFVSYLVRMLFHLKFFVVKWLGFRVTVTVRNRLGQEIDISFLIFSLLKVTNTFVFPSWPCLMMSVDTAMSLVAIWCKCDVMRLSPCT